MEEKILELYAFASSEEEEKKHRAKFPALSVRKITEKAEKQGAETRFYGAFYENGYRYLRTAEIDGFIDDCACSVNLEGYLGSSFSNSRGFGTCVAFRPIYDPTSKIIKSLKTHTFASIAWDEKLERPEDVSSPLAERNIFGIIAKNAKKPMPAEKLFRWTAKVYIWKNAPKPLMKQEKALITQSRQNNKSNMKGFCLKMQPMKKKPCFVR